MLSLKDHADMKRVRSTWLAEKLDMNFARAHAIVHQLSTPSRKQEKDISKALHKEARASLHQRTPLYKPKY